MSPPKASSVVKFSPKPRNRGSRRSDEQQPRHPDHDLITACVDYAYRIAGAEQAYEADPTEDLDFARPVDNRALAAARKNMHLAANCSPSTIDGLRAKASIVRLVLLTEAAFEAIEMPFLRSLADDIERLLRALSKEGA